jgi:transcriptional regulator with GAF, ATPase, and Fis domain
VVLPPREAPPPSAKAPEDLERKRLEEALRQHDGNVAATARALGMHRTQLRRLLQRHGLAGGE